jgi:hypothetical protein
VFIFFFAADYSRNCRPMLKKVHFQEGPYVVLRYGGMVQKEDLIALPTKN